MLDIYDDIVSPDEKDAEKIKEGNDDGDDDEDAKKKPQPSVEDALKSEIDSIKEEDKLENRKFKIVDLGLRACIFVLMSKEAVIKADPSDMVVRYLSEVKETSSVLFHDKEKCRAFSHKLFVVAIAVANALESFTPFYVTCSP